MDRYALHFILMLKLDDLTLPILLIAGLLIIYVALLRPMWARKTDPLARTPQQNSLAQQRAMERDLSALIAQLTTAAGEMTSQIEAKAEKLQAMLKEADAKIAELRDAAKASSTVRPKMEHENGAQVSTTVTDDPQHIEVYDLADQGRCAREIARRLNRPHGEVELILALRESK